MSYQVANPEDRFSHDEAQLLPVFAVSRLIVRSLIYIWTTCEDRKWVIFVLTFS